MLSTEDKDAIRQSGEITRRIEFNDPASHCLLQGNLRILKTENPKSYNFVEVGEWVRQGHHSNSIEMDSLEFRERLVYDENGNTLSRRIYEKHGDVFEMKEDWSSELIDGRFLQHVKAYENGVLVREYTRNVLDYLEPKSDVKKNKIPFGTDTGYYLDGRLAYTRRYDDNGKLISEEKDSPIGKWRC
jgi:hypothetical protein